MLPPARGTRSALSGHSGHVRSKVRATSEAGVPGMSTLATVTTAKRAGSGTPRSAGSAGNVTDVAEGTVYAFHCRLPPIASTASSVPPGPPPAHETEARFSVVTWVNGGSMLAASNRVVPAIVAGVMRSLRDVDV